MAIVLPQASNWQAELGRGLGTGIGAALQNLATTKLNQLNQQQEQSQLYKALVESGNWTPELARLAVSFPANQRLEALNILSKNVPSLQQSQQVQQQPVTPAQVEHQDLSSILNQMQNKAKPLSGLELLKIGQQEQLQKTPLGQKLSKEQSPLDLNVLANEQAQKMLNLSPQQQNHLQERIKEVSQDINKQKQLKVELDKFLQSSPQAQQEQLQQLQQEFTVQQNKQPISFKKPLTESERIAQERLELKKQEMSAAERREAFKITKEERKEINDKAKAARSELQDLNRIEELEKEGKLNTPGYVEFLKRSGLEIPALLEPGSEEFNKIVNNFIRGARSVYGARITNQEMNQYLQTLPSLSQSPEGRKRVIANLKFIKQGDLAYQEAAKEVIKENHGVPPLDFAEQVEDKVGKKLDRLAVEFRKNIIKEVPKPQDKLVTGLQATLGGILGTPGRLLSKAGPLIAELL